MSNSKEPDGDDASDIEVLQMPNTPRGKATRSSGVVIRTSRGGGFGISLFWKCCSWHLSVCTGCQLREAPNKGFSPVQSV